MLRKSNFVHMFLLLLIPTLCLCYRFSSNIRWNKADYFDRITLNTYHNLSFFQPGQHNILKQSFSFPWFQQLVSCHTIHLGCADIVYLALLHLFSKRNGGEIIVSEFEGLDIFPIWQWIGHFLYNPGGSSQLWDLIIWYRLIHVNIMHKSIWVCSTPKA